MEYRQQQLENGMTVLAEINPNGHSMAMGFFVRTGARDEGSDIAGVSHFLEHMVFKGTPNRSAEDVNRELDEMGSHSNARTSEESTIYHATVLPEFQTPVVELMADILRPSLRDDDFEMEKQVIIEEIMMYDDQPPYGGHERIMAEYFGRHPLSQSVLGTVDSVGGLTPQQMHGYFDKRYSPDNIALVAAGNVDFEKLVVDAERLCGSWQASSASRDETKAEPSFGFHTIHKEQAVQQYILQLAPGPSALNDDRFATRVLSTILGDDGGSRVYWEFIDTGLAEAAGMGSYEYDDNGVIMSYICCEPERAQDNLNRLTELQKNAVNLEVSQHELDLAKSKIASHIILASERTDSRMFSVGMQWLKGQDFKTPADIAELYEAVTLEQVNSAAQKYPLTPNMTVVVGPNNELRAID